MLDVPSMANALGVCAMVFLVGLGAGIILKLLQGGYTA